MKTAFFLLFSLCLLACHAKRAKRQYNYQNYNYNYQQSPYGYSQTYSQPNNGYYGYSYNQNTGTYQSSYYGQTYNYYTRPAWTVSVGGSSSSAQAVYGANNLGEALGIAGRVLLGKKK